MRRSFRKGVRWFNGREYLLCGRESDHDKARRSAKLLAVRPCRENVRLGLHAVRSWSQGARVMRRLLRRYRRFVAAIKIQQAIEARTAR